VEDSVVSSAGSAHPIFVQPKFTGRRFDNHALPVDVAADLKAYQALLVALAKHLFLLDNPDRKKMPRGFGDVHLAIQGMDDGSTRPALVLVTVASVTAGSMPFEDCVDYFSQSHDLIVKRIAAPDSPLPKEFPKKLLSHFNQFGRSLRENEAVELQTLDRAQTAVLNHEMRKKLVLTLDESYERETEISGYIWEADFEKYTFKLRIDNDTYAIVPMSEEDYDQVRQSIGHKRDRAFVKCIAVYDSHDHLKKVIEVESFDVIKNYYIAKRFDTLGQLDGGWCDGRGIVPDVANLKALARMLAESYPEHLCLPTITPTLDGNLLMEWGTIGHAGATPCYGGGQWVNINLSNMSADFQYPRANEEGVAKHFDLHNDIESFIAFLLDHIPKEANGTLSEAMALDAPSLYTIAAERLADHEAGRSTVHSLEDVMREYGLAH